MVNQSWKRDIFLGRRVQDSIVDGRSDLEIYPLPNSNIQSFHVVTGKSLQSPIKSERTQLAGLKEP
jgi:hypothetical protein